MFLLLACTTEPLKTVSVSTPSTPAESTPPEEEEDGDGPVVASECDVVAPGSIQAALDAAWDGDTVVVCPGVYREHLRIERPVTLRSRDGAESTALDGGSEDRVLWIDAQEVVIEGFTVRQGQLMTRALGGAGAYLAPGSGVTFRGCTITENEALGSGGGVHVDQSGSLTLEDTTLSDNQTTGSGDSRGRGILLGPDATLVGGVLTGHPGDDEGVLGMEDGSRAEGTEIWGNEGLAVRGEGSLSLLGCDIHDNTDTAVLLYQATADLTGTVVHDNVSPGMGALLLWDSHVVGGEVRGNTATDGGGLAVRGTNNLAEGTVVEDNVGTRGGGGVFVGSNEALTLVGVTVQGNEAPEGGGLWVYGQLTVRDSLVTGNTAEYGGGAGVVLFGQLDSQGTDWGTAPDDNTPDDVASEEFSVTGQGTDFTCTASGCTP
jgi:hypothetical protein